MAKRKQPKDVIKEKLDYLGLDLDKIPKQLKEFLPLNFMVVKGIDESQYKEYRYIPLKDIQILLSPTHRMDSIDRKYKRARPIADYLDNKSERNVVHHATFLRMLQDVNIKDIEKIEEEQKQLNKKIPFKIKYEGNYLWQIYYSETTDRYFMIVPTEDSDYSTFFYLLKKQLENRRTGKIFVPIRNANYSSKYLKRRQFEDLENYLWIFTNDWALIYEVYDRLGNMSIQIIGETQVYEKIRSPYRIKLASKEEAVKFYRLLRAMFILQTELPNFYKFRTNINRTGGIEFYYEKQLIEYETIAKFINDEYLKVIHNKQDTTKLIKKYKEMYKKLRSEGTALELEYLTKERQISTFLECKKTFFGKVKYYFKYSKKRSMKREKEKQAEQNLSNALNTTSSNKIKKSSKVKRYTKVIIKENYTLDDLIKICREYEKIENEMKNLLMDINAMKLKNKNMRKKIENATAFIAEIDQHKKSIFEFWKYSNKDEVAQLAEGEAEEVNIIKKVKKAFDYEQDIEKFGEDLDNIQRKVLTKDDMDNIFIATTTQYGILNKIKSNRVLPKDVEASLKQIKIEQKQSDRYSQEEDFDIFGSRAETKIREIKSRSHRENPKDKFKILEVNKNSKQIGYKLALERVIESINRAINKVHIPDDIIAYKAVASGKIRDDEINIFNLNPEEELQKAFEEHKSKITLYKIHLKKGSHAIGFTNSIFYDNTHKTLPKGMDLDPRIIVDTSKLDLEETDTDGFKMIKFENEKNDFGAVAIRTVNVIELSEPEE